MDRNDSPADENRTPYKRRPSQKDMVAYLNHYISGENKENAMSSPEKHCGRSEDSDKLSRRYGSPDFSFVKSHALSPRKTTCDKKKVLDESPGFALRGNSSAKRERRQGRTPSSLFQDSTEKKQDFLDYQEPSALKAPDLTHEHGEIFLQELESPFDVQLNGASPVNANYSVNGPMQALHFQGHRSDVFGGGHPQPLQRGRAETGKCNCRNSQCLKMYCDCLKMGKFCDGCNCVGCENHAGSEERKKKVGELFEKSKKAAGGLVVSSADDLRLKVMKNGCNCRKNSCLKKYCECHQFGLRCGRACRCLTCQNGREEAPSD